MPAFPRRALSALLLLLVGCQSPPPGPPPGEVAEAPDYAALRAAHNARVEQLQVLHTRGVIEWSWTDGDSDHMEQGTLEIWRDRRDLSVRVTKFGEILAWWGRVTRGTEETTSWFFDGTGDPTVLRLGSEIVMDTGVLAKKEMLTVSSGLALLGVHPLPELEDPPVVRLDRDTDAWSVTVPLDFDPVIGRKRSVEECWTILFDRQSLMPRSCSLSQAGERSARATHDLRRYRSVPVPGRPRPAWPRISTLIDLDATDRESGTLYHLRIALDAPTADVADEPMDRVFDLEALIRALRPDRIEGKAPPPGGI